jgi:hypothetical protein
MNRIQQLIYLRQQRKIASPTGVHLDVGNRWRTDDPDSFTDLEDFKPSRLCLSPRGGGPLCADW